MRLAIWNWLPAELLIQGNVEKTGSGPVTVVSGDPFACVTWLAEGHVDVALVPTFSVLRDPLNFDVVPGVGLVTLTCPYARLFLSKGLGDVKNIAFDPRNVQEVLLTRLLLKEHYQMEAQFVPYKDPVLEGMLSEQDAALVVGAEAASAEWAGISLDLGQEWYELTARPMTWGLFAARDEMLSVANARAIQQLVHSSEKALGLQVSSNRLPVEAPDFVSESLSGTIDFETLEGLDELMKYLFFYGALDEVPEIPFIIVPDEQEGSAGIHERE